MKTIDLMNADPNHGLSEEINNSITIYPITEYISWIDMEISPVNDLKIRLNNHDNLYLHYMYNHKDAIELTSTGNHGEKTLTSFQSALIHEKRELDTFLCCKKNGNYRVSMVQLAKFNDNLEINNFFRQFEEVFKSKSDDRYILHTGMANLKLGEYVKKIMQMPKSTFSDRLMISGYIHILLGMKLKQFVEQMENPVSLSLLTRAEIEQIHIVTNMILKNPEENYKIEHLCQLTGLSANKLQIGFKEMHANTICNYVSQVRLIKAEELLKTTDMNVSQIVYSLGWSSRSYFCKIFKERYNCTPKNYQALLAST